MKRLIKIVGLIFIFWFICHTIYLFKCGYKNNFNDSDILVVFGSKVNEDGTLSSRLEKRLECAMDVYNKVKIKRIIVSGGLGKEGYFEAIKMKSFLVEKGIGEELIMVDNKGVNTEATVQNSLRILDSLHYTSLVVVSQYFHIARIEKYLRNYNIKEYTSASPVFFEFRDLYAIPREFIAYYYN